jgi:hypothetical protein
MSPLLGTTTYEFLNRHTDNEYLIRFGKVMFTIGVFVMLSFIFSSTLSNGGGYVFTFEEYNINKVTTRRVFYGEGQNVKLSDSNVQVMPHSFETDGEDTNKVVVETKSYKLQWICKVLCEDKTYYVYLSKDNYIKLKNTGVIYFNEQ